MFDTIKYSLTNGAASVAKAVLFLVLAIVVANLVKGLVLKLIDSTKIKEWLGKLDPEDKKGEIRTFISKLVYLLVFLLFVPAIFSALGMSGIMSPITSILNTIWGYVPNVLAAAIIVAIGSLVAKLVGQIVTKVIAAAGLDAKLANLMDEKYSKCVLSNVVGKTVHVVLVIFFAVQALYALNLNVLINIGNLIIGYMPEVLTAVIIFVVALLVSAMAEKALTKSGFKSYAVIAKVAILVVAGFMILNELHIATSIVNAAFVIVLAAIGVAFALSFGLGGREFAAKVLEKFHEKK